MFKCWIYISGESNVSVRSSENLSDKSEEYGKESKEKLKESKQTANIKSVDNSPYFPGMRRFGFLERFTHFS